MKGKFIVDFLKDLKDMVGAVADVWARTSYKGFSYNKFQKNYHGFSNLKRRGIIKDTQDNHFVFTPHGRRWLRYSMLKYFHQEYKGLWDKKWRVIIFDIPQEMHKERIRFRNKLKFIGCVMLQKSVFVFPYPCHEEIGDIAGYLEVQDYVDIIIAESVGFKEKEFKKIFDLD